MKKLILLMVLFVALTSFKPQTTTQECWKKGYISGWCHAQNQNVPCMKPAAIPYPPILPYNQRDCKSYFNAGIIQGASDYARQ